MVIQKTKKMFGVGVDPGSTADRTAIAVVERVTPPDWNGPEECPPKRAEYHIRRLVRLPPGTYYKDVATKLLDVLSSRELNDTKEIKTYGTSKIVCDIDLCVDLVIDQTAVTEEIVNLIVGLVGKQAYRAVLSGTHGTRCSDGLHYLPKPLLTGGLEALLETSRLKIPTDGQYSRQLVDELLHYRNRKTSLRTSTSDTWRDRPSDDLVFAVALACWRLKEPGFAYEFLW